MSKIARFDSAGAAANAAIDLGSDQSDVWVEFRLRMDIAAVTFGADNLALFDASGIPAGILFQSFNDPPANTWTTFEYHYVAGDTIETFVDGVSAGTLAVGADLIRWVQIGGSFADAGIQYVDDVKIGTTRHGTDLLADDFEDGTLDAWTDTEGDATVIDESDIPSGQSSQIGRVLIAFDDGPLEPDPIWTRIDDVDNLVADIEITAGKQSEFDQSETNHATVRLNDTTGDFDPNNFGSDYFGKLVGKQIMLQLYNPVTAAWYTRFRGTIDRWTHDLNPVTRDGVSILSNVAIECVGVFDYLAGREMIPGQDGDPPPTGSEASVFWEDGEVNERIISMLTFAGIASSRYVVFDGNVMVIETLYDTGDSFLVGLRDAADAETPVALANIYEDRYGRVAFHGRQSRLDPDGVAAAGANWDFQRYKIGDGAAITFDPDYAQLRPPFQFAYGRDRIVNTAWVIPRKETNALSFDRTTIPALVQSDSGSIDAYGPRTYSYQDSINGGHKTNGETASEDTTRTSLFLIANYKDPQVRFQAVTVKALRPGDDRAVPTWNVLSRADISDVATVTVGYPGGTGVDSQNFIEGWTQTITPLSGQHDMVELELNLSPVPTVNTYDDD